MITTTPFLVKIVQNDYIIIQLSHISTEIHISKLCRIDVIITPMSMSTIEVEKGVIYIMEETISLTRFI